MKELFGVADMLKLAVEDERTGVVFYSTLAGSLKSPGLRKTAAGLREQEEYHLRRFETMLGSLGDSPAVEQYAGEYLAYLQTLSGTRAFPDAASAARQAAACQDDLAALDLAGRFERDTLMLFHELRPLVPDKDRAIVDEIVKEEQQHLVSLAEARRQAGG